MAKKKILMVCEAFGGGVFTYVSQLCNDMVDEFDIYLAYSLRPQTPKNYKDFLDQRVHLIEMKNVGVKGLTNFKSDIAAIKELRQIEKEIQPDVIHLHSSVAGGLGRLAYKKRIILLCIRLMDMHIFLWDRGRRAKSTSLLKRFSEIEHLHLPVAKVKMKKQRNSPREQPMLKRV